jgi:carbonic anhydrase/acetyltransferase-like protein (isoleucine patch superfamily)
MITAFRNIAPAIDPTVFVAASAVVVGDVVVGADASLWFHTVVRGDVGPIRVGARSNLQDHVTVHVVGGKFGAIIGDDVTIGHRAIVHGCTLGNRVLIGMGAVVLDGAEIADDCLVGAGALITPGMRVPAGRLVLGQSRPRRPRAPRRRARGAAPVGRELRRVRPPSTAAPAIS